MGARGQMQNPRDRGRSARHGMVNEGSVGARRGRRARYERERHRGARAMLSRGERHGKQGEGKRAKGGWGARGAGGAQQGPAPRARGCE